MWKSIDYQLIIFCIVDLWRHPRNINFRCIRALWSVIVEEGDLKLASPLFSDKLKKGLCANQRPAPLWESLWWRFSWKIGFGWLIGHFSMSVWRVWQLKNHPVYDWFISWLKEWFMVYVVDDLWRCPGNIRGRCVSALSRCTVVRDTSGSGLSTCHQIYL